MKMGSLGHVFPVFDSTSSQCEDHIEQSCYLDFLLEVDIDLVFITVCGAQDGYVYNKFICNIYSVTIL